MLRKLLVTLDFRASFFRISNSQPLNAEFLLLKRSRIVICYWSFNFQVFDPPTRNIFTFSYSLTFNVTNCDWTNPFYVWFSWLYIKLNLIVLFTGHGAVIIANSTTSMDNKTVDIPVAKVQEMIVVAKVESQPLPPPQSMNLEASDQPKQQADEKIPTPIGPQFIPEASKNVTSLAGRVASLNCRIKNLDNWTVCQYLPRATALSWQQLPPHWNKKCFILVGVG